MRMLIAATFLAITLTGSAEARRDQIDQDALSEMLSRHPVPVLFLPTEADPQGGLRLLDCRVPERARPQIVCLVLG